MNKDGAPQPGRARRKRPSRTSARPTNSGRKKTAREYEQTTKRRGELSELAFILKATSLGFHVSKPYGDSERYDFIVDTGQRLLRIQIKSTTTMICGLYRVNAYRRTNNGAIPYQPNEIDFLIAHVIPEDAWFILPIAEIKDRTGVLFPPRGYAGQRPHFAAYREAWDLLREPGRAGSG